MGFMFLAIPLFAQNDEIAWKNGDKQNAKVTPDNDVVWVTDAPEGKVVEKKEKKKGPFYIPDRLFELGLLNLNLGVSNNFITTSEIFKEKVSIDLNKLSNGFNFNVNLALNPVFINFKNKKNTWGFGLSTGLDLIGVFDLNGKMLTFREADKAHSDIGAAAFAEMKLQGFFTIFKFKLKLKPAAYFPILYAKADDFTYTYINRRSPLGVDETIFNLKLDARVYTAFPINDDLDFKNIFNIAETIKKITAKPGFDFSIGAEYPLSEALGITKKIKYLDFDIGVDFLNIPIYPAVMEDYMRMTVNLGSDDPIDFFSGLLSEDSAEFDFNDFYSYSIDSAGKEKRKIKRPFKMLVSVNWRPFGGSNPAENNIKTGWLTVTPIFGFAVNPLYKKTASFEGGLKTRLSLVNLINFTLNIGYYDRIWKNSLDFAINLRVIEIDLGVSMQSANFLKSWKGGGFGASFGLKLGW